MPEDKNMIRSFKFRLRPNATQAKALNFILADSCETYNAALQERKGAWKLERKSVTYNDQCAEITQLRKDPTFAVIAADIQRDPLRRLDHAFRAFFRRCKSGEAPGFPRFRSKHRYDSFTFGGNKPVVGERGERRRRGSPRVCPRISQTAGAFCSTQQSQRRCRIQNSGQRSQYGNTGFAAKSTARGRGRCRKMRRGTGSRDSQKHTNWYGATPLDRGSMPTRARRKVGSSERSNTGARCV